MKESSTYQAILDEGQEEGLAAARQEAILLLLRERFGDVPTEVEGRVRATADATRLQDALRQVIRIATPADIPL